jgi:hypothetical protein
MFTETMCVEHAPKWCRVIQKHPVIKKNVAYDETLREFFLGSI